MSLRFAAEGAHVVVGDVREEPREGGRPTAELIADAGGRATFVASDASRADDIDLLVRTAVEAGECATALSALVAAPSLAAGTLKDIKIDLPRRSFYVVRHKERYTGNAERTLLDMFCPDATPRRAK